LDDVARTLPAHDRKDGLSEPHDAEEVRLDLGAEIVGINVFDGSHVGVPGVVDQNVEATPPMDRGIDGRADLIVVRDIERDNGQVFRRASHEVVER